MREREFFTLFHALLHLVFKLFLKKLHIDQKYLIEQFEIFKALALWADALYKSKCPSVCPSVCLLVRLSMCSLLRYRLNVFWPPLPEVVCQISLGKCNGKKWFQIWTFLFESGLKSPRKKKFVFCWFCLTKVGGNNTSGWIRDLWLKGVSLILAYL